MGRMANGTHSTAKGHVGVISNGTLEESQHHSVTDLCQHAFLNILLSEKFTSLCKLLFENFKGMTTDSIFSLNFIDKRMKDGAYDCLPVLFCEDIEQVIYYNPSLHCLILLITMLLLKSLLS